MTLADGILLIVLILTGSIVMAMAKMEERMEKFNLALVRLQASVSKAIAKIDSLQADSEAALEAAVAQLDALSDSLDAKTADAPVEPPPAE